MSAPDLPDASCAACRAPVVAIAMRGTDAIELVDAAHTSEVVVLGPKGGMVASRSWTPHRRTCGRGRARE